MGTGIPTVIAACAGTVIAATPVAGLTAAAQEYVLGRERDVAIELNGLSSRVSNLEKNQAEFSLKLISLEQGQNALERGQNEIRMNMLTREDLEDLNAAIARILLAVKEESEKTEQ